LDDEISGVNSASNFNPNSQNLDSEISSNGEETLFCNRADTFAPRSASKSGARLLLQIHDELIFEVQDDKIAQFVEFARAIMQNVVRLNVPLVANASVAKNWAALK